MVYEISATLDCTCATASVNRVITQKRHSLSGEMPLHTPRGSRAGNIVARFPRGAHHRGDELYREAQRVAPDCWRTGTVRKDCHQMYSTTRSAISIMIAPVRDMEWERVRRASWRMDLPMASPVNWIPKPPLSRSSRWSFSRAAISIAHSAKSRTDEQKFRSRVQRVMNDPMFSAGSQ